MSRKGTAGRPLKGRDAKGKPVSITREYAQTTVRLPPEVKARLDALAMLEEQDRSTIVAKALGAYVVGLPAGDREAIEKLAVRVRKRRADTKRDGRE